MATTSKDALLRLYVPLGIPMVFTALVKLTLVPGALMMIIAGTMTREVDTSTMPWTSTATAILLTPSCFPPRSTRVAGLLKEDLPRVPRLMLPVRTSVLPVMIAKGDRGNA